MQTWSSLDSIPNDICLRLMRLFVSISLRQTLTMNTSTRLLCPLSWLKLPKSLTRKSLNGVQTSKLCSLKKPIIVSLLTDCMIIPSISKNCSFQRSLRYIPLTIKNKKPTGLSLMNTLRLDRLFHLNLLKPLLSSLLPRKIAPFALVRTTDT